MKNTNKIITFITGGAVLALSLMFAFGEKRDFLENENRKPAPPPTLSWSTVSDGSFTLSLEEYIKDRFPFRDSFMKAKTASQLYAGYKNIDGVFVSHARLMQEVAQPDITRLTKSAKRLFDAIENKNVRTSMVLIPSATEIYPECLPPFSQVISQSEIIDSILSETDCNIPINATQILFTAKERANVFYVSDHHWTSFAALAVFDEFCKMADIPHTPMEKFDVQKLSGSFKGTLYSRVPSERYTDTAEKYARPQEEFDTRCANGATSELFETQYFAAEYLDQKDKYSYFGGGNFPLTILENHNALSQNEIVVIKDSFANCFVPHLTEYYSKVHIIDPRHFKGKRISAYINENKNISDCLIMYGLNSLNDNSGVSTLS